MEVYQMPDPLWVASNLRSSWKCSLLYVLTDGENCCTSRDSVGFPGMIGIPKLKKGRTLDKGWRRVVILY
jgi:hypothetical protein